ncbi:MAG TPA: beta-ketoacyl synthase N-terminal-like domain-containing protein [Polyangiaceae bacterium]|nr:beta-ketoacyl synthase N-terminal-like domain-containing protein [Polyangiaceae bacterium]
MTLGAVRVTGWSVHNTLGGTVAEFQRALEHGRVGLTTVTELPDERAGIGLQFQACLGSLGTLQPSLALSAEQDTRQLRLAWLGLAPLWGAIERAGQRWGAARVGLLLGTSTGGLRSSELAYPDIACSGLPAWYSCRDGHAFDAAPRIIAQRLGISGPVAVVSTACSSAGKALAAARRWIGAGVCDAVITGGVDSLCLLTVMGFRALGVLGTEPCRPFAPSPTGMNVAEGAAWLMLERCAEHPGATERTTELELEIEIHERPGSDLFLVGSGETNDAYHMVTPDPTGAGARSASLLALADAGIEPADVDYVNAHGTGTAANDGVEGRILRELFPRCPIESSKRYHGHQLGATAATEAIVTGLALDGLERAPAAVRSDLPAASPEQALDARHSKPRIALSNTLAFGGSNVSLAFATRPTRPFAPCAPRTLQAQVTAFCVAANGLPTTSLRRGRMVDAAGLQPRLLSEREWGRAGLLTRLFATCLDGLADRDSLATLPIVYGSAFGPVATTLELLEQQQRRECSPLRFQNSVHSAPMGTLSIALGAKGWTTSVAAGTRTLGHALLEALCWLETNQSQERIIVLVGDEAPPQPLLNEDYAPLAVGLLLSRSEPGCGTCRVEENTEALSHDSARASAPPSTEIATAMRRALDNPSGDGLRVALALETGDTDLTLPLGVATPSSLGIRVRPTATAM